MYVTVPKSLPLPPWPRARHHFEEFASAFPPSGANSVCALWENSPPRAIPNERIKRTLLNLRNR